MSFLQLGQVLNGRYRVDAHLGGGAMADVYRVWDQMRSCPLAIKVLRASLAEDPAFLQRFQREADALARLQHPSIVRLYGLEREGDIAFLVMDYVDGQTLAARLAQSQGPLPLEETRTILRDLCAALAFAHRTGILHRDVKPANVLVGRDGRVLLSDFGIAKAADSLTLTAFAIGTPAYMSPEQCQGKETDARSDLYSLGVVLYELLAGRRPFRGEQGPYEPGSTRAIFHEHLHAEVPPLRDLNPNVSSDLQKVVVRTLAKQPSRRYQDAEALWTAVDDATRHVTTQTLTLEAPEQATVYLDESYIGKGPQALEGVAEGVHRVRIIEEGKTPVERTLVLGGGAPPASRTLPTYRTLPSFGRRGLSLPPAVLAGLVAVLAVGIGLSVWALVAGRSGSGSKNPPISGAGGTSSGGNFSPFRAPGASPTAHGQVSAVSAGAEHTCAIKDGAVWCWGSSVYGQLGNGKNANSNVPVVVSGLEGNVTALSAGTYHNCAIRDGVWCWGANQFGELGDGTGNSANAPVAVSGLGSGVGFISAGSAGGAHTCALKGGAVLCWGWNTFGELGDGTRNNTNAPVAVSGLSGVSDVSATYDHTCAVRDGGVWCWGDNTYGQLGNGSGGPNSNSNVPVPVSGLANGVSAVSAGGSHTCALKNGGVWCWGQQNSGNGSGSGSNVPVAASGLESGVSALSAGNTHTCALKGGVVWCWGSNHFGQLGDGTTNDSNVPVTVSGLGGGVTDVTAGGGHTCALNQAGLWCWGSNDSGQLGNGTSTTDSGAPVLVSPFGSSSDGPTGSPTLAPTAASTPSVVPTPTSSPMPARHAAALPGKSFGIVEWVGPEFGAALQDGQAIRVTVTLPTLPPDSRLHLNVEAHNESCRDCVASALSAVMSPEPSSFACDATEYFNASAQCSVESRTSSQITILILVPASASGWEFCALLVTVSRPNEGYLYADGIGCGQSRSQVSTRSMPLPGRDLLPAAA